MVFFKCIFFFRVSFVHLIKDNDSMQGHAAQIFFFKVKTLLNNAFKFNCEGFTELALWCQGRYSSSFIYIRVNVHVCLVFLWKKNLVMCKSGQTTQYGLATVPSTLWAFSHKNKVKIAIINCDSDIWITECTHETKYFASLWISCPRWVKEVWLVSVFFWLL